jgi:hypothetical protein
MPLVLFQKKFIFWPFLSNFLDLSQISSKILLIRIPFSSREDKAGKWMMIVWDKKERLIINHGSHH